MQLELQRQQLAAAGLAMDALLSSPITAHSASVMPSRVVSRSSPGARNVNPWALPYASVSNPSGSVPMPSSAVPLRPVAGLPAALAAGTTSGSSNGGSGSDGRSPATFTASAPRSVAAVSGPSVGDMTVSPSTGSNTNPSFTLTSHTPGGFSVPRQSAHQRAGLPPSGSHAAAMHGVLVTTAAAPALAQPASSLPIDNDETGPAMLPPTLDFGAMLVEAALMAGRFWGPPAAAPPPPAEMASAPTANGPTLSWSSPAAEHSAGAPDSHWPLSPMAHATTETKAAAASSQPLAPAPSLQASAAVPPGGVAGLRTGSGSVDQPLDASDSTSTRLLTPLAISVPRFTAAQAATSEAAAGAAGGAGAAHAAGNVKVVREDHHHDSRSSVTGADASGCDSGSGSATRSPGFVSPPMPRPPLPPRAPAQQHQAASASPAGDARGSGIADRHDSTTSTGTAFSGGSTADMPRPLSTTDSTRSASVAGDPCNCNASCVSGMETLTTVAAGGSGGNTGVPSRSGSAPPAATIGAVAAGAATAPAAPIAADAAKPQPIRSFQIMRTASAPPTASSSSAVAASPAAAADSPRVVMPSPAAAAAADGSLPGSGAPTPGPPKTSSASSGGFGAGVGAGVAAAIMRGFVLLGRTGKSSSATGSRCHTPSNATDGSLFHASDAVGGAGQLAAGRETPVTPRTAKGAASVGSAAPGSPACVGASPALPPAPLRITIVPGGAPSSPAIGGAAAPLMSPMHVGSPAAVTAPSSRASRVAKDPPTPSRPIPIPQKRAAGDALRTTSAGATGLLVRERTSKHYGGDLGRRPGEPADEYEAEFGPAYKFAP